MEGTVPKRSESASRPTQNAQQMLYRYNRRDLKI